MANKIINNVVSCPRVGESRRQITSRKQRLFSTDKGWYFKTREGIDIGPYENKKHAENGINSFIREIGFNLIRGEALLA